MKPSVRCMALAAAVLFLSGGIASAAIVNLSFEGEYSLVEYGRGFDNEGIGGTYNYFDNGLITMTVTVEVDDSDLVPTSDATGDHYDFQGEIVEYELRSPVVASELLDSLSEGVSGISDTDFANIVEVQYTALDSGGSLSDGHMRLYASVTGSVPSPDQYSWNSNSSLLFLAWTSESPDLASGTGTVANAHSDYVELPEPNYTYPDTWYITRFSETWTLNNMSLTGFEIGSDLRQRAIVPEPASAVLLGLGLSVPLIRRLRRR